MKTATKKKTTLTERTLKSGKPKKKPDPRLDERYEPTQLAPPRTKCREEVVDAFRLCAWAAQNRGPWNRDDVTQLSGMLTAFVWMLGFSPDPHPEWARAEDELERFLVQTLAQRVKAEGFLQ